MKVLTTCPDDASLVGMLDSCLSEAKQDQMTKHFDSCETCQQRLESLVTHGLREDLDFEHLGDHLQRASEKDSTLSREAIEGLTKALFDKTTACHTHHGELSLDFLDPSDNPNSLGRLGQYEITEVIGRGGMGIALKGRDTTLDRVVAVKVLVPELAANATARKRFLREARAAAAVSHDHVVTTFAVEHGKLPYLAMEYIDGPSLQQKIDRQGPLQLVEILRIGMQTAYGLAAAHAQGLIHRDIKPSNILLQNSVERVQITDFGLARAVDDVGVTRSGEVTGTPQYMSPEQAQGLPADQTTDLFSLGCVLYAMCTGRSPFRADSTMAVLNRVCNDSPRPIHEVNSEIPEWFVGIVDRLLAKDPRERFQTAGEVADLLSQYLAHVQQPTVVPLPKPAEPRQIRLRASGRPKWYVGAILLAVALGSLSLTEATGVTQFSATVIRIVRGDGTLIVEIDDPNVSVSIDGQKFIIAGAGPKEIRLPVGKHELNAVKDGRPLHTELLTITRNKKRVVKVSVEAARREDTDAASETKPVALRQVVAPAFDASGSVSADGKYLSFVDWETGDLAIRELATGQPRRLTTNGSLSKASGAAWQSVFSPDGKHIAYEWYNNTKAADRVCPLDLRVIDINSGGYQILFNDPDLVWLSVHDWSRDAKYILATLQRKDQTNQIALISSDDGSVKILKSFESPRLPRNPRFSADSRYIAYSTESVDSNSVDVFLSAVDGGHEVALMSHGARDIVLGWAPSGDQLLFASDRSGSVDAWAIPVSDGRAAGSAQLVKLDLGHVHPMTITRDGSFYYSVSIGGFDVYVATLDPQTRGLVGPPMPASSRFAGRNVAPFWSRDGRCLAFSSVQRRKGSGRMLCLLSPETGQQREFPINRKLLSNFHMMSWSPDNQSLVARNMDAASNRRGLFEIDVRTGDVSVLAYSEDDARYQYPQWTPDGKSIFYQRVEGKWEQQRRRIMRFDIDTRQHEECFPDQVPSLFSLSPDGKQVALVTEDESSSVIKRIPVAGGEAREVLRLAQRDADEEQSSKETSIYSLKWSPDGGHLFYLRGAKDAELWQISVHGGEPRKLELNLPQMRNLTIHPDGRKIAVQAGDEGYHEVWVMQNFLPPLEAAE